LDLAQQLGPDWGESGYIRIKYGTSAVGRNASWVTYAVIPAAPKPTAPSGYITDSTPTFTWPVVSGAASYTLSVTDKTTSTTAFTTTVKNTACTTTTCSYTPTTPLTINHNYQWRMLATNLSGTSGAYSSYLTFSLTVPPVPVLKLPVDIIDDTTPTFTWAVARTATSYNLVVRDGTSGTTVINVNLKSTSCTSTTCSYTHATALSVGKTYKWKVLAANALGKSAYSSEMSFLIAKPAAPVTVSPVTITGSAKPTFTWMVSPAPLRIRSRFTITRLLPMYLLKQSAVRPAILSYCTYTSPSAILPTIHIAESDGQECSGNGPYSSFVYFQLKVPAVPVLSSPQGDAWSLTPTFSWNAVEGAKVHPRGL
jgi:hypothetical protein